MKLITNSFTMFTIHSITQLKNDMNEAINFYFGQTADPEIFISWCPVTVLEGVMLQ